MGTARTYNVSSVQFLSSTSTPTRGGVQVAVQLNNDPDYQTGFSYLNLEDLDNSSFAMGLSPLETFEGLKRERPIKAGEPVDISHIKITYLKQ